jgi:hypothetical protein
VNPTAEKKYGVHYCRKMSGLAGFNNILIKSAKAWISFCSFCSSALLWALQKKELNYVQAHFASPEIT